MANITIDNDKCIGCKMCYNVCSVDVIRFDKNTLKPVIQYPEDCMSCAMCVVSCPVYAISLLQTKLDPLILSYK